MPSKMLLDGSNANGLRFGYRMSCSADRLVSMARRAGVEASSEIAKTKPSFRRAMTLLRKRLRELRRMHGLSYRELEERSGVNWRQIVSLETGDKPMNPTL